jgi:hypothetical protein
MPLGNEEEHIAVYRRHNQVFREYFLGRDDDFFEVCWEEGDGWTDPCAFLDKLVSKKPLRHKQKGRSELLSRLSYVKNMTRYTLFPYPSNDSSPR